jgi:hypothetical protein
MLASLDRNRFPWLILAIALMFASAVCSLLHMDAVGKISGWIGLPEYESYVPHLQRQAMLWSSLAVIFPFFAALLLGFGKSRKPSRPESSGTGVITAPEVGHEWTAVSAILTYLLRLGISALASLAFTIVFIVVVSLLEKLGMRAP